jgi:hypothetical protein
VTDQARIPVLSAYVSADGLDIHVACHHCRAWHRHGTGAGAVKLEHRVAHCWRKDSPFREGGYHLQIVGIWDRAIGKTRPWANTPKPNPAATRP